MLAPRPSVRLAGLMAARRLLIVMLVLLTISTIAAALVPPTERRKERGERTGTGGTAPAKQPATPRGDAVEAQVDAAGDRPATIALQPGDTLSLAIASPEAGEVEIADFGLVKAVAPGAPARFDLLLRRPGRFDVRLLEGDRRVATIAVLDSSRPRSDRR